MPSWLRAFRASWTFLTRIPVGGFPYPKDTWSWVTLWFPVVGLCLGAMQWGIWSLLEPLSHAPRVIIAVAVGVLITGGFHEDGLADSADALGGAYDRDGVLRILKDSRIGAFGAMALFFVLAARVSLLVELGPLAAAGFLVGQSVSRALPVVQLGIQPYVRRDDPRARSRDVARSGRIQAVVALGWIVAIAVMAVTWLAVSLAAVVAMSVGLASLGLVFGGYIQRRAGGLTGDFLGATQQLGEVVILLALVLF